MAKLIYLIRHGETEWTKSGQHTGITDIPLLEEGKQQVQRLKGLLKECSFTKAFTSPSKRCMETAQLCGIKAEVDNDLMEWNYGEYEGLTTQEIHKKDPHWTIFSKGAPGGESIEQIEQRAKRILKKTANIDGTVVLFSSGHFSRALGSSWIKQSISFGAHLLLSPASLSILGYEKSTPVLILWNEVPPIKS